MTDPGAVAIEISGRKVRVGSNPALTQVVPDDGNGAGLEPGNKITIRGRLSAGSYLYLRASSIEADHAAYAEALFRGLGLADGGVATIDPKLDHGRLVFDFLRPDGTSLKPLRWSHAEGPGYSEGQGSLPAGYADTPTRAVETYVAAINGHDGKMLCRLFQPPVAKKLTFGRYPCWITVGARIGYGDESYSPVFRSVELLNTDDIERKTNYGVAFTGVPAQVRYTYRSDGGHGVRKSTMIDDLVWLREVDHRWRIAKPSLTLLAAMGGSGKDARAIPDPLAAQHEREAKAREHRREEHAKQATLVRPTAERVHCSGQATTLRDPHGDARPFVDARPSAALLHRSDIRSVRVTTFERGVCVELRLSDRPRHGRLGIQFFYRPGRGRPRAESFIVTRDPTGIHAGRTSHGDWNELEPAGAAVSLTGSTVTARFNFSSQMPVFTSRNTRSLRWSVFAEEVDSRTHAVAQDSVPDGKRGGTRVIRQSDGVISSLY